MEIDNIIYILEEKQIHYVDISGPASIKIIVLDLTSFPSLCFGPGIQQFPSVFHSIVGYSVVFYCIWKYSQVFPLMFPGHLSQMLTVCFLSFRNSNWFPMIVNILLPNSGHHSYNKVLKDIRPRLQNTDLFKFTNLLQILLYDYMNNYQN